jgi:hypothetical protein
MLNLSLFATGMSSEATTPPTEEGKPHVVLSFDL